VAPIRLSSLLKITGLFCRISSLLKESFAKETYNLRSSFAKETCNFKEPANRSHPIKPYVGSVAGIHRVGCRQLLIEPGVCRYL